MVLINYIIITVCQMLWVPFCFLSHSHLNLIVTEIILIDNSTTGFCFYTGIDDNIRGEGTLKKKMFLYFCMFLYPLSITQNQLCSETGTKQPKLYTTVNSKFQLASRAYPYSKRCK